MHDMQAVRVEQESVLVMGCVMMISSRVHVLTYLCARYIWPTNWPTFPIYGLTVHAKHYVSVYMDAAGCW